MADASKATERALQRIAELVNSLPDDLARVRVVTYCFARIGRYKTQVEVADGLADAAEAYGCMTGAEVRGALSRGI